MEPLFNAVLEKFGNRRSLWEYLRGQLFHLTFNSFTGLWSPTLNDAAKNPPLVAPPV